jgi:hypothetical protein
LFLRNAKERRKELESSGGVESGKVAAVAAVGALAIPRGEPLELFPLSAQFSVACSWGHGGNLPIACPTTRSAPFPAPDLDFLGALITAIPAVVH